MDGISHRHKANECNYELRGLLNSQCEIKFLKYVIVKLFIVKLSDQIGLDSHSDFFFVTMNHNLVKLP